MILVVGNTTKRNRWSLMPLPFDTDHRHWVTNSQTKLKSWFFLGHLPLETWVTMLEIPCENQIEIELGWLRPSRSQLFVFLAPALGRSLHDVLQPLFDCNLTRDSEPNHPTHFWIPDLGTIRDHGDYCHFKIVSLDVIFSCKIDT